MLSSKTKSWSSTGIWSGTCYANGVAGETKDQWSDQQQLLCFYFSLSLYNKDI